MASFLPEPLQELAIKVTDYIVVFEEQGLQGLALNIVGDGKQKTAATMTMTTTTTTMMIDSGIECCFLVSKKSDT